MKKIILILLLIVLFAVAGFFGLKIYTKSKLSKQETTSNLPAQPTAQLPKAPTSKAPEYKEPVEIKIVSGKVTEIKGNSIILETVGLERIKNAPKSREVVVTDVTKIFKQDFKDQATFVAEMVEYEKVLNARTDKNQVIPAPSMTMEKEIKIADLKAGDQITVEAGENIKTSAKFKASKITLEPHADPAPEVVEAPVAN